MSTEPSFGAPPGGMQAPIPRDDSERLAVLRSFGVLDGAPELKFDELTRLAAEICQVPMAFVSLVDQEREFFLSAVGSDLTESPRNVSFCGHTILQEEPLVVPDTLDDPRFAGNPNVVGGPQVRFYAGVPLVSSEGHALGALCVKDTVPRALTDSQLEALRVLANQVGAQLELRRQLAQSRATEEELRETRALYQALVENSPDLILLAELDRTIRFASRAHETLLGYRPEELVGSTVGVLTDPTEVERVFELLSRALAGEQTPPTRIRMRHKDGSLLTVEATFAIIDDRDGTPLVLSACRDLTSHVELEAQYQQAQQMETIGQLTSSIAHDFNNLLVPMIGYTGLALGHVREDQPKLLSQLKQIESAAERARELVGQLLDMSRPRAAATPQPLSLDEVVATAKPLIRMLLGPDVQVEHTPVSDLPSCIADPERLNQLLMNLAANAHDALPADGGLVTIATGRRTLNADQAEPAGLAPGEYVTLTFADNGCGMDAAAQAHIFEPFFTTKGEHGTGLGLATVHKFVRDSSGAIEVTSAPGQGTRFTISLPASTTA